ASPYGKGSCGCFCDCVKFDGLTAVWTFSHFPVGKITLFLKNNRYTKCVGGGAPVFLAAIMKYLAAEVLEFAGNVARENKKSHIISRHILLAVRNDEELGKLLGSVIISSGGVLPNIHQVLFPKK
ncbi:hypothetical protein KI387_034530, partial [Taxus chinensis]